MARTFQLNTQLNLQAPKNIKPIVNNIRQQLKSVSMKVDVKLSSNAISQMAKLNNELKALKNNINDVTRAANGLGSVSASLKSISSAVTTSNSAVQRQAQAFKATAKQVAVAKTEMEAFGAQSALAIRRFAAFSVGTAGIIGFATAITRGVKSAIDFNKEMVRLSQVTGKSLANLKDVSNEISRLSVNLGVSSSELLIVSTTLAQAGLSARDTKIALEALAKSALAPSFDDMKQTTEGVIAIMRQFGIEANQVEKALGSVNAVAAAYAVESQDLISAVRISGGVFAAASKGVAEGSDALNQFISIITSVRQTTRESAESIATGLRTIFTRIQRPQTIEYLKQFGVELQDVEGKFVGPYEAIKRLSAGLKDLDTRDVRFAQIAEELGGYRQLGKVIPLIQQFSVAQQAYQVAQAGSNSLAKNAETAQESLANRIAKTQERFLALIRTVSESQTFGNLANILLKTADGFIKLAESIAPVIPYITILAGVKLSSSLIQYSGGFLGEFKKKKFAKGGLVPGSGSGDTVPAMLTPGEFVIRKDAVKAIGAENLSKFANAAGVPTNKQVYNKFGLTSAQFNKLDTDTEIQNKVGYGSRDALRAAYVAQRGGEPTSAAKPKSEKGKKQPQSRSNLFMDGNYGGLFFRLGTQEISAGKGKISTASLSKEDKTALKARGSGGAEYIYGQPRQHFINKQTGDEFDTLAEDVFDKSIRTVLDSGLNAKGVSGKLAGIGGKSYGQTVADIKKQVGFESFAGNIFEAYVSVLTNQVNTDRGRRFDFNPAGGEFGKLFSGNVSKLKYADAKYTSSSKARESIIKKAVSRFLDGGTELSLRPLSSVSKKETADRADDIIANAGTDFRRKAKKKARGGSIDSVPAMLTPGEFVINKDAAKRLGSAKLNKLNNADKVQGFAKGGFVQHFKDGGGPEDENSFGGVGPVVINDILDKSAIQIMNDGFNKAGVKIEDTVDAMIDVIDLMKKTGVDIEQAAKTVGASYANADSAPVTGRRANKAGREDFKQQLASGLGVSSTVQGYYSGGEDPNFIGPTRAKETFGSKVGRLANRVTPGITTGAGKARDFLNTKVTGNTIGTAALIGAPLVAQGVSAIAGEGRIGKASSGAVSGALAGAATGATIGSIIPGVGTGVGAVVGGAVGAISAFTDGLKQADLDAEFKKLAESSARAGDILSKFQAGKATSGDLSNAIGGELRAANEKKSNSLFDIQGKDFYGGGITGKAKYLFNKLPGGIGNTATESSNIKNKFIAGRVKEQLEDRTPAGQKAEALFRDRLAKGGRGDGGNTDALRALAYTGENALNNTDRLARTADGPARVKLEAELGAKQLAILTKEQELQDTLSVQVEKTAVQVEMLNASFARASENMARVVVETDKFNVATENIVASANGTAQVGRLSSKADIYDNPGAYSPKELESSIGALSKTAGLRSDVSSKLSNGIVGARELKDELPKSLLKQFSEKNQAELDPKTAIDSFVSKLEKDKGLTLPQEIKDNLSSSVKAQFGDRKAGSKEITPFIKEQLPKAIDELDSVMRKAAGDLQKGLEGANSTYIAGVNQYIGLQLKYNDDKAAVDRQIISRQDTLSGLQNKSLTTDRQAFGEEQQIRSTVGNSAIGKIVDTGFVKQIGSRNDELRTKIADARGRQAALNPADSGQKAITDELAGYQTELSKNNKALNLVSTSTTRLAGIQQELALMEGRKSGGFNALQEFNSASPERKREIQSENRDYELLTQGKLGPNALENRPDIAKNAEAGYQRRLAVAETEEEKTRLTQQYRTSTVNASGGNIGVGKIADAARDAGLPETAKEADARKRGADDLATKDAADQELLKDLKLAIPDLAKNLNTQLSEITVQLGEAFNRAFKIPADAGLTAANFKGFDTSVQSLNTGIDALVKMPKEFKHEIAPVQVALSVTGLDGQNDGLKKMISDMIDIRIGSAVPLDSKLEAGRQHV